MAGLDETWELDARLEQDTILLHTDGMLQTRLMNDKRWPWIIIVPVISSAVDIEDVPPAQAQVLFEHLAQVSKILKAMGVATSTNVATIGNIVTQMHWHVVGRREGDPNWPGPVWGYGQRQHYQPSELDAFAENYNASRKAV